MEKIFLMFCCCFLPLSAEQIQEESKAVCLNMIVKNEKTVIERCLASVKPFIDYWVIVDTGSSDGTQKIIKEFMKDIPGELHERPWVNFAHNRNEALDLARDKAKYCLFIDADEELRISSDFIKPVLDKDYYFIPTEDLSHSTFQRIHFIKNKLDWHWYGVIHEYLFCENAISNEILKGICNLATASDGNRSQDSEKHRKDAVVLENALKDDPNNSRYMFYLAQTYFNCKEYDLSIKNYEKRVALGDNGEEVFCSLYMIGKINQIAGYPFEEIVKSYTAAYLSRPTRAEPLYRIGRLYLGARNYLLAYAVLSLAISLPIPDDVLFIDKSIYEYSAGFELANSAALIGKEEEARLIYLQLQDRSTTSPDTLKNIKHNLSYLSKSKEKRVVNP